MTRKLLFYMMCVLNILAGVTYSYGYTDEELLIYDNLYLQLPWEAAKYIELTQENKSNYTHKIGSCDEYSLDFDHDMGTPVVAAAPGHAYCYKESNTVAPDYGNHVKVDHGYFYTLYAHLSSFKEDICGGYEIRKGDLIGYAGSTGASTGSHLHFGLFHGYAWEDGYRYSVESKIVVANEGEGPYRLLESTAFRNGTFYLSGNFKSGEEGMIVCETQNDCYVDTSGGVGGYDPGDDTPTSGGPDANVKHVEVSDDGEHWHSSFIAYPGQQLQARINVTNKGDEPIDYFEVFLHRSPDKDFNHEHDYSFGREEEEEDLEPGDDKNKHRDFTAPTTPGTYYLFAYISRVDGENGGEDEDCSNNVSRNDDREEYAPLLVQIPEPWASFSLSPTLGFSPLTVKFSDTSRWGPTSWLWEFGDGQTSTVQHPSHVYTTGGVYTVSLTVSNEKGETKTAKVGCVKVDVKPSFRITNPTATDNWRSEDVKDIKWEARNFPSKGTVKIEYSLNDGASWRIISGGCDNDGIKHWDMCEFVTTDTTKARIRLTSKLYPSVQAVSPRFEIDHARGCK